MNHIQKNQDQDFRYRHKLGRGEFSYKSDLRNQVNDTTLFTRHIPVEENVINLSQQRSERFIQHRARRSTGHLQPRGFTERHQQSKLIKGSQNLDLNQNLRTNYNIPSSESIHRIPIIYPDGVALMNLNNINGRESEILRNIPPYLNLQSQNHLSRKNVCMQFYTKPRIDLHVPIFEEIDKIHFSSPFFYHQYNVLDPQTFKNLENRNLASVNNLKVDFTDGHNYLSQTEPAKINFQDICVLFDVLVTRIKWNFDHILDSINTHDKVSIDYWKEEGQLKFKLCLTDVINVLNEIKKLNAALFSQCRNSKKLQVDELTQELEAFIKCSRKILVTEMQDSLKNEYVQYCKDFFNNQLKILFLEHKRKYRAIFEQILTENYRRNLKSIYREGDHNDSEANAEVKQIINVGSTKLVESATQTLTDALNSKCRKTDEIRKVTSTVKQIICNDGANDEKKMIEIATQTSKGETGVKTNCAQNKTLKTIKNQSELHKSIIISPQNPKGTAGMQNNHITITQCPNSPRTSKKTNIPNSYNLIQKIKAPEKTMAGTLDKHEATDTVIITPKYPIKTDLLNCCSIKNSTLYEGQYFKGNNLSYRKTDLISKKRNIMNESDSISDYTPKNKKRELSHEANVLSKQKRTENGENIIIIDSAREKNLKNELSPINNMKNLDVDDFKSKISERMNEIEVRLINEKHKTVSKKEHFQLPNKTVQQNFANLKHKAEQSKNDTRADRIKMGAQELVKTRRNSTSTLKVNVETNTAKTDSADGKVTAHISFSKANNQELKQSDNVSVIKTSIYNKNKKFEQAEILENTTKEEPTIKNSVNFGKKEGQISSSLPEQKNTQKSLVRTSIINFINKNSLREKCIRPKVKVIKQTKEIERATLSSDQKDINSKDHLLKHSYPNKNVCEQTSTSPTKKLEIIGTDLNRNRLNNENQAGMGFVQQIQGLEVKHHLTPEEYVNEMMEVNKMNIPTVFKCFYTFVTKQQILQQVNPVSFKLFLELFNNGGLQNFYRKYVDYQKKHEL